MIYPPFTAEQRVSSAPIHGQTCFASGSRRPGGATGTKPQRRAPITVPDFFEDSLPLPAQAYLKVCSAASEASLSDVKPASPPAIQGASPPKEAASPSSGTTVQRRSVLHTEEITKWQDNRMSTKQVTITVTQSIHRVDRNGKVKKSLTTYEVMKQPVESLKPVATQNAGVQRN
ncbi:uncharacterized protein baalcb isoform 2-T11 [Spinachia spinachia]